MLSSRLLNDVFVSRVNQTIDYKRGINGNMLSSHLLNDVFVSRVSQAIETNTSFKRREESMLPFTPRLVYGMTHTGHEHIT
jgi:hypothetical protein